MHVSAFSGDASAQANMSKRGRQWDAALLQKSILQFLIQLGSQAAGIKKNSFLHADISLSKCQVVLLDCFYSCPIKQLLIENNISLFPLVGVALSWASSAHACQLWLSSTAMRGVFPEKAAATPAFKMHSQRGPVKKSPLH